MINIKDKKECCGCCACFDACQVDAISLEVDHEGFWYPSVDKDKCVECGRCVSVCPELQVESINLPKIGELTCFSAQHKDMDVRMDSTSGGMFSVFTSDIYEKSGAVAGAVYRDDFSVQHIVSDDENDLERLRSSKYLQSDCSGMYSEIKRRLDSGQEVLACGCPCQMAALRLFLAKAYENLIICDFVCLGINSPKVFRKHLDDLERAHSSKVVYVKAKNKEHGWRSLTFKAVFENGDVYYGNGNEDNFTRGYLRSAVYCRPSCFDCKFKGMPRLADISIGDFWGCQRVTPELDDNTGTSCIMCNTEKGRVFFDKVKDQLNWAEIELEDIAKGNRSLYKSLSPETVSRKVFFDELSSIAFTDLAQKYFPRSKTVSFPVRTLSRIKRVARAAFHMVRIVGFSPRAWWQFLHINFLRKNTKSSLRKRHLFIPTPYCVFDIHPDTLIELNGMFIFGRSKVKGSRLESRLRLEKGTEFRVGNTFYTMPGIDIQVFAGGKLTFAGGAPSGMNLHTQIVCKESVTIGKDVLIGRNVVIRDYDAHYIQQKGYKVSAPIVIEEHCWIGDGAYIGKGVKVGSGSIVAARSWVVFNVPENTLVAGYPAMPISKNIRWKA